jgi:hypothetical protein
MSDERPLDQILPSRQAGVAEAKHVRLSAEPSPYHVDPREEPGPEALPAATIYGPFRPIVDRGSEANVISTRRHDSTHDTDLDGEQER